MAKRRQNEQQEKRPIDKSYLIGFIISIIICAIITGLVIVQEIYGLKRDFETQKLLILTDGFTISGSILCLFYLLIFVSDEGAFDILSYSIQLAWVMTFHRNVRETKLPATYAEYRQLKREKPRLNLTFILFSGLIFFIIGLILLIFFKINIK